MEPPPLVGGPAIGFSSALSEGYYLRLKFQGIETRLLGNRLTMRGHSANQMRVLELRGREVPTRDTSGLEVPKLCIVNKALKVLGIPQSLIPTYVYDLPFFRNNHSLVGRRLGGWELSGAPAFMTGERLLVKLVLSYAGSHNLKCLAPKANTVCSAGYLGRGNLRCQAAFCEGLDLFGCP